MKDLQCMPQQRMDEEYSPPAGWPQVQSFSHPLVVVEVNDFVTMPPLVHPSDMKYHLNVKILDYTCTSMSSTRMADHFASDCVLTSQLKSRNDCNKMPYF